MSNHGIATLASESLDDGDTLIGIEAIAKFRNEKPRRTAYLLEKKLIPAGQVGRLWHASKRVLREHHERVVRGQA